MVHSEDILNQQLLESLEEIYFKIKRQVYINYTNHILSVLVKHLYYYHGKILPIYIEDREHKMKE